MNRTLPPLEEAAADHPATEETTFGTFRSGEEEFALAASDIREVVTMPDRLLPASRSHTDGLVQANNAVVGVFNLRGDVVPVVDIRQLFGQAPTNTVSSARVAVLDGGDHLIGALFDSTGEVLRLQQKQMRLLPENDGAVKGYLQANDGRLITLLTPASFLGVPQIPRKPECDQETIVHEGAQQFLIVRIGPMHLAIDMQQTLEINRSLPVRSCMTYFHHCDGIIALRGATVARLDLRKAIGVASHGDDAHKLAFVHDGETVIALPVDDVVASLRVEADRQVDVEMIQSLQPNSFMHRVLHLDPAFPDCPGGVPILDVPGLFDTCHVNPQLPEGTGEGLLTVVEAVSGDEDDNHLDQFFLTFSVGAQTFGLEMTRVQEIRRADEDRIQMPEGSDSLAGLMNVRGQVLPLLDLNRRYGEPLTLAARERRAIVTETSHGKVGLLVDQLGEIIRGEHTRKTGARGATLGLGATENGHRGMRDVCEVHALSERYDGRLLYLLDPDLIRRNLTPPNVQPAQARDAAQQSASAPPSCVEA